MEELDEILLHQFHSTKKTMKVIKNLKKILPKDNPILKVEEQNLLRQKFFEDMIENKDILKKKKSKHKCKTEDVLYKNPIYYMYRNTIMAASFGYMFFANSMQNYWNQFRKDKDETTKHDPSP